MLRFVILAILHTTCSVADDSTQDLKSSKSKPASVGSSSPTPTSSASQGEVVPTGGESTDPTGTPSPSPSQSGSSGVYNKIQLIDVDPSFDEIPAAPSGFSLGSADGIWTGTEVFFAETGNRMAAAYNPVSRTWRSRAYGITEGVSKIALAANESYVAALGLKYAPANDPNHSYMDFFVYHITNNQWTTAPSTNAPMKRKNRTDGNDQELKPFAIIGQKLIVPPGFTSTEYDRYLYELDLTSNVWSKREVTEEKVVEYRPGTSSYFSYSFDIERKMAYRWNDEMQEPKKAAHFKLDLDTATGDRFDVGWFNESFSASGANYFVEFSSSELFGRPEFKVNIFDFESATMSGWQFEPSNESGPLAAYDQFAPVRLVCNDKLVLYGGAGFKSKTQTTGTGPRTLVVIDVKEKTGGFKIASSPAPLWAAVGSSTCMGSKVLIWAGRESASISSPENKGYVISLD